MVQKKKKKYIRLLPMFILIAVLALSLRVNNVFDVIKENNSQTPLIFHSKADANVAGKDKEVDELSEILESYEANTITTTSSTKNDAINSSQFAESEIIILQELAERRELLEVRSREIDKKAIQLKVAEEQIDAKLAQLKEYENKLKSLMADYNEKEREKINSLVKLYSTMKPKDAARIFDTLDIDIVVALLREMKPATSSAILSQMDVRKTKAVTDKLIGNEV